MGYKEEVQKLDLITIDSLAKICASLLPFEYRNCPWNLPYGDKDFSKIFTRDDELNGYTAAYTSWHKGKLETMFNNTPQDTFVGEIAVVDWGCGQGLATLYLYEYLAKKHPSCKIKEVILVEPSEIALDRAIFNIEQLDNSIRVSTVNKFLNDVYEPDIKLFENRKVIHLFSNILDIKGISLKKIAENLRVNLGKDNVVLCVSPSYPQMARVYDSLLKYFTPPIAWQFRDIKAYKENSRDYTYFIQSLKLLANHQESIIRYEYFPAVQFRTAFVLDCINEIKGLDLEPLSYFDVYCPYELGASVSEDINPVFAVLNNIITRGLPTKASLYVEKVMSESFGKSLRSEKYGGVSYRSKLDNSEAHIVAESVENNSLGLDKILNQLIFSPLAVSRVEKLLVEALISNRITLEAEEWNILVEECDVPFARIAFEDFREMLNHLAALTEDYESFVMPRLNLTVISNKNYSDSPLLGDDAIFNPSDAIRDKTYDLVIRYSSEPRVDDCNFSEYQVNNDCYFCIFPSTNFYADRYVYTTERLVYKELCTKDSQGNYIDNQKEVGHLRYFL